MQPSPTSSNTALSRRKFLLILLSGLSFVLMLFVFTILAGDYFKLSSSLWIISFFCIYLLVPIPSSMSIAHQSGDFWEGQAIGLLASITGIVLVLLIAGIYLVIVTLQSSGPFFLSPFGLFLIFFGLNIVGFLISALGATIGAKVGEAWRR